ncbi:Cript family protein [Drepanopeziza brunnea f. sp. 'multigermtubi' MB_m1]|uniref:Cysteine-rich PDZ-binding protein n=1 Tax=Marssonina brunnea f. sp. multigermtubi (strain MB_m1) TaxID=1072389 RepID=K1WUE0_MARBU|nr:Cript family protein [Drepanopeziza brunnea f. sp. 'multigermtubi' MB_m1]EKD21290.1 Cript family protein [Drepanopeziza brunnea f. sp. 'multigermtubi' MB_m1]
MVCGKCQKVTKATTLATPGVKKKSEMYYGSPAGSSKSSDKPKTSATLGNNGIAKARGLSRPDFYFILKNFTENPYATYSSSCSTCKTKIDQGRTYCHKCAYKANACAICGKKESKSTAAAPVIAGQKFTLK